jgi:2-oxoacid:acceptor oxidoreductase delta subunit (pyruvate/2-ketoisovalerate family)
VFAVRIHGRGGQGVVTAAELLALAAFLEERHAQAFPSKQAARNVDTFLRGEAYVHPPRGELVTFDEVVAGLDETNALFEARRCLSCDNCYGVCPDNAVIKLDQPGPYQYEIDLDFCKGCVLCAAECPAGAIEMTPEEN